MRILRAIRERHIGKVMFLVYVCFAVQELGRLAEPAFTNRVVHFLNTHTNAYPHFEPEVLAVDLGLKGANVLVYSVLAWVFYRAYMMKRGGESGGRTD